MLLSAKTRKKILSIPFAREVCNILVNVSNKTFYKCINKKYQYNLKIRNLKDAHKGDRCFIVGNGPSLTVEQLEAIKLEDCFGANRIYKIFNETDWRPKYYIIQDKYDCTQGVYDTLQVENLLVSDYYWKEHGMNNPHAICYHSIRTLKQNHTLSFSEECDKYIQASSTVTYTMIQFAVYMGYKEIFLIGMDHTYKNITNDKGVIIQRNNVKNHVFDDEVPNEVAANLSYMEDSYREAKKYCELNGILIKNATIGGNLEIFERVNFWDII